MLALWMVSVGGGCEEGDEETQFAHYLFRFVWITSDAISGSHASIFQETSRVRDIPFKGLVSHPRGSRENFTTQGACERRIDTSMQSLLDTSTPHVGYQTQGASRLVGDSNPRPPIGKSGPLPVKTKCIVFFRPGKTRLDTKTRHEIDTKLAGRGFGLFAARPQGPSRCKGCGEANPNLRKNQGVDWCKEARSRRVQHSHLILELGLRPLEESSMPIRKAHPGLNRHFFGGKALVRESRPHLSSAHHSDDLHSDASSARLRPPFRRDLHSDDLDDQLHFSLFSEGNASEFRKCGVKSCENSVVFASLPLAIKWLRDAAKHNQSVRLQNELTQLKLKQQITKQLLNNKLPNPD
ncbi:hypothetical protein LXL04_034279 [Taraxacum kok-saghyz]